MNVHNSRISATPRLTISFISKEDKILICKKTKRKKKKKKVGSEVGEMERGLGEGAWLNERSG